MRNVVVIGLVGEKRGGKGTSQDLIREVLREYGVLSVASFSTSDAIAKTLREYGVFESRENRMKFAVLMDSTFGEGRITERIFNVVREDRSTVRMVDSIRWLTDKDALRQQSNNLLLYVTALPEVRWKRGLASSDKPDDQNISYEEFLKKDESPTEKLIRAIGAEADWKIDNNFNDREFLKQEIRAFVDCKVIPLLGKEE